MFCRAVWSLFNYGAEDTPVITSTSACNLSSMTRTQQCDCTATRR